MTFGKRLKILRKDFNISQDELGKKVGVARTSIANYETNRNYPTSEVLEKLSNVFSVSIDYLLGKTDIRNANSDDDPLGLTKIGFNIRDYNPPTKMQKEQIKTMLEIILKENKIDMPDKENN